MSYKSNSFLLVEILLALTLISGAIPLTFPSLKGPIALQKEIEFEEALERHVSSIFIRLKSVLQEEEMRQKFKEHPEPLLLETGIAVIEKESLDYSLSLELTDKKNSALLVQVHLKLQGNAKHWDFSQKICLKKN